MIPNNPHLLVFLSCTIPSSWVWAEPSDLLLTNRILQKSCHFQEEVTEDCAFLLTHPPSLALPLRALAQGKPAAKLGLALWRGPCDKDWHLQPVASENLWPFNSHVSELGSGSSPGAVLKWLLLCPRPDCSLVRDSEPGDTAKPCLDSWPQKEWDTFCHIKPTDLG